MSRSARGDRSAVVRFGRDRPALLGVVGLVVSALLLAVALNASRLPFFTGETFHAEFTDSSGLQVGEEVRVAGIKVGQVREITLDDDVVTVTFDVDGARLGRDTAASIEVKTLLGQHYLALTPAGSGELDAGATIPVARTTTPLNVVPAFQELTATAGGIDGDQLAQAFDSLSGVLESSAPEVRGTLSGLEDLSRSIADRDAGVRELFDRAEGVTGTLAARNDDLAALLGASEKVLTTLDAQRQVITEIIQRTADVSDQLRGLVADQRKVLGPALDKLDRVLAVLRANRRNITETLRAVSLYGREFTGVGGTGRFFDGAITLPSNFAVCSSAPDNALSEVLDPVLSAINQQVNGSSAPCLPLGSATGGTR